MAGSNYYLGSTIGNISQPQTGGKSASTAVRYGRVLQVVLDESVEVLDAKGNKLPIGGIRYRDIASTKGTPATEGIALPIGGTAKQYPLLNEIVTLIQGPTSDIQSDTTNSTTYYGNTVNLWGSPHHNALPEPNTDLSIILGKDVVELSDINPLYPFPGDTLIEGRQGQSIRIGGNKSPKNPLVDSSNNGKPYMLFSNGQFKTDNGIDHIIEDVNKDPNSIYLLSDHKTSLKSANNKRDSYDTTPLASDQYIGNQVIINGGRLYFNAKEDSAFISAKESIGLNAKTINIDADSYFCVDAKKIYLGKAARTATAKEPVILGIQLENWLTTLLDTLESVATAMSTATTPLGGPVTQLIATGPELKAVVTLLKSQVITFQSKKVFTE